MKFFYRKLLLNLGDKIWIWALSANYNWHFT